MYVHMESMKERWRDRDSEKTRNEKGINSRAHKHTYASQIRSLFKNKTNRKHNHYYAVAKRKREQRKRERLDECALLFVFHSIFYLVRSV